VELIEETFIKDRNIQLLKQDITQKIITSALSELIHQETYKTYSKK